MAQFFPTIDILEAPYVLRLVRADPLRSHLLFQWLVEVYTAKSTDSTTQFHLSFLYYMYTNLPLGIDCPNEVPVVRTGRLELLLQSMDPQAWYLKYLKKALQKEPSLTKKELAIEIIRHRFRKRGMEAVRTRMSLANASDLFYEAHFLPSSDPLTPNSL